MIIRNDPQSDGLTDKPLPGSYEWWYFDAIDDKSGLSFVIIFYEGNPFSRRYIQSLQKGIGEMAHSFPAISISIYMNGKPCYYSFLEYKSDNYRVEKHPFSFYLGDHSFRCEMDQGNLVYHLSLNQKLDSGHTLQAELAFSSLLTSGNSIQQISAAEKNPGSEERDQHSWNLIQNKALVTGFLTLNQKKLSFNGVGYHDHNVGCEPMKESFYEWYWGRMHFSTSTLIYYLMFHNDGTHEMRAWLQHHSESNSTTDGVPIESLSLQALNQKRKNVFGLRYFEEIEFSSRDLNIKVIQNQKIDSGPFYVRWLSKATLFRKGRQEEITNGFSEYIRPERIYMKKYWPLVDMRIRYLSEKPHWVQKSKLLYPLTW